MDVYLRGIETLDNQLAEKFREEILTQEADANDQLLQRKAGHIREDISLGDNRYFYHPLS